jgi:dihydrofolate reductase
VSPPPEPACGPMIALVVAMGENGALGKDGDLPWRLHGDMRHFRAVTLGKPVIMGRQTFASLGRVLDQRCNIILSREQSFHVSGAVVARSLQAGLEQARIAAEAAGAEEIMVIGGAEIFKEAMPLARRIYLTEVHASPDADTWFPRWDRELWREVSRQDHPPGPRDDHAVSFVLLERA